MHCGGASQVLDENAIVDGKYALQRKISEGAGGEVWLTADSHGNQIALKTLKWSPLKSKELATERFKNEFAIFKTLAHPNISGIYDFGYDDAHDVYYFTTELLTGGDLRTYRQEPIETIEPLLLQALRSLEYLRNSGLLHLDIKPQNFLLREGADAPTLVLIDFGIATFRPSDKPGGTANYMPPEIVGRRIPEEAQYLDLPEPDHRSDLYSLGVTFYYVLTGKLPFAVKNKETGRLDTMGTLKRHLELKEPPPPSHYNSNVPKYLDTIIMKLMAFHPDDRYPAAAVAAQALRYRSPRALEPEDRESLLSYLPKQGKMIDRRRETAEAEKLLADIAKATPHATPILCIAGGRGTGRTRLIEYLKPLAQQLELDTHLLTAQRSITDELAAITNADAAPTRARALLIDDVDLALTGEIDHGAGQALVNQLKELIHRARRWQKLTNPTTPPTFIALAINTDRISVEEAYATLDLDDTIAHTMSIENFSIDDVSEYLTSLLGEESSTEVVESLHRLTEGNPLFITEQLERMISDGLLFSLAGRPDASTLEAIGLEFEHLPPPQSLTQHTISRYDDLAPGIQDLAALMACWGEPVDLEDLRHTFDGTALEGAIVELIAHEFVQRIQNDDGHYEFANPMAASIIEQHLMSDRRAKLHSTIANYLERHRPHDRSSIDHHRARGANTGLRFRALERLAKNAEKHRRPHEATEYLEALYAEVPPGAWDMRADVLVRLGKAYGWAYMPSQAEDAFRRLIDLRAPKGKRAKFRMQALELMALAAIRRRELDGARDYIAWALELIGRDRDSLAARIRLENFLAGIDLRDGRAGAAVEQFEKTAELAKTLLPREASTITNNELGEALLQADRPDEAKDILSAELAKAEDEGDLERMCSRHYLLGNVCKHNGYEEALDHYSQAFEIARQRRLLRMQVRLYNSMGNLGLDAGHLDQAIENYRKGLALSEQIDSKTTSVELMVGLGLAYARTGDYDASIEHFEAGLDFVSGPMGTSAGLIRRFEPTIYVHLGDAYYHKHDFAHAIDYLERARHLDEQAHLADDIRYSIYGTFTEIYLEQGNIDKARLYLPTLEDIVEHFPVAKDHLAQLEKRIH